MNFTLSLNNLLFSSALSKSSGVKSDPNTLAPLLAAVNATTPVPHATSRIF